MAATMIPRLAPRSHLKLWLVTAYDGKTEVLKFGVLNSETDFRKIVADLLVGGWKVEVDTPKVFPQVPLVKHEDVIKLASDYLSRKAKAAGVKAAE